ncbi:MAG: hypothetical protein GXP45_00725 [bacterium]|nr:hypothetical protein [bacterium]
MESSMMKNDFGKMFAFNIVSNFKSLQTPQKKRKVKQQEQEKFNNNLNYAINNTQDPNQNPKERNKYIVRQNVPAYQAQLQKYQSIDELQKAIQLATQEYETNSTLA